MKSKMVRWETTYDPEGNRDDEAYCPDPECDFYFHVDYNFCPDCGQKVHYEPQSEREAKAIAKRKNAI